MTNQFVCNTSGAGIEAEMENNKQQPAAKEEKAKEFDTSIYLDTRLANGEKEKTIKIRILPKSLQEPNSIALKYRAHPMKVNPKMLFKPTDSPFRTFMCLNDPTNPLHDANKKCPLCEKYWEYHNAMKAAEAAGDKNLAETLKERRNNLREREVYVVRVIQRDKENEGVKFWRFKANSKGEGVYDTLMNLYKTRRDDYRNAGKGDYNIFDVNNGKDLNITIKEVITIGQDGKPKTTTATLITDDTFESPITKDIELGNKWLSDPHTAFDAFPPKPYDYLSLVAEDKVPTRDKLTGGYKEYIPRDTQSDVQDAKEVDDMKKQILSPTFNQNQEAAIQATVNEPKQVNVAPTMVNPATPFPVNGPNPAAVANDDDDLPF